MFLTKIHTAILDFFFPIRCVGCKEIKTHCCEKCLSKITLLLDQMPRPPLEKELSVGAAASLQHNETLGELIHRFKYDGAKEIGPQLAALFDLENQRLPRNSVLVPVPLHPRRRNARGFNQSVILAQELAKKYNLQTLELLQRHRYTQPQVELKQQQRLINVRGAFSLKNSAALSQQFDPEKIYVIVDDVLTTGATMNECADVLRKNGARKISGLVIARAR